MEHKGTVSITTDRLILRRFVPADLPMIYENCWRDPDVWTWTNYAPMPCLSDVQTAANMFTPAWFAAYDRPDRYSWAIARRDTDETIGRMFGMHPEDDLRQVELAYELGKRWWNRGCMTEAVSAVLAFFLDDVGMNRVYAYHASVNPASGRVMRKCGMVYEGTQRQACRCNGGIFDRVNYGILADDPRP